MAHEHHHHHHAFGEGQEKKLMIAIGLNFIITLAEVIGGLVSGSLALLSDAMHNFSDTFSLITSWIAIRLSKREKSEQRTFGYKRAGILAALLNSSILLVIGFFMIKEAILRFFNPEQIATHIMLPVAIIGLLANLFSVLLLKKEAHQDINIKSAYIHLFADTLSSVVVILGGIFIHFFKIYWIDSVLTVLIALYVLKESFEILREAVHILMQNTPADIDVKEIQKAIEEIELVKDIHHVHVWQLTDRDILFEGHLNLAGDIKISECGIIQNRIEEILHEKFDIDHVTLQFEYECCEGTPLIKQE